VSKTQAGRREGLPVGWELKPLGEVVKPTRPRIKPSEKPQLPFIGMEHVEAHTMKLLDTVLAGTMKSNAVHFQPGDVLYGRLRPYLNKVYRPDFEGLCSAEFIVFPRTEGIESRYVQYFLNSSAFVSFATHLNAGDRPRVDFDQIASCPFPVAPLDQQKRIVAEIDKQFSRLDEAVTNLKRVKANLKRYKAAVLKAAVEGKLTSSDKKCWENKLLGDVITSIQAGKSFKCEERPPRENEVGVMKVSAVTWGMYDELETKTCLHPSRVDQRLFVKPGDFLFSRANTIELVGACVIAGTVKKHVMLSDKILRLRFSDAVLPEWVLYWLRAESGRGEIQRLATGNQESMRNIGQDRIRQIRIEVPPLSDQKGIVAEMERRLSINEGLANEFEVNLKRVERLRQSILQRAFGGNLVPTPRRGHEPQLAMPLA
jgi:type I restriction enzyme, S subunit